MTKQRLDISKLVPSQVPAFVRTDYQTFLLFIQAYYDYLDQSGVMVDMGTIRDIDLSVEGYIEHIKSEIAPKIPFDMAQNRFQASRLKDLYDAKGSSSSFKLLFRLLYNEETDIIYPATQMLIPSDGRWEQPTAIFVNFSSMIGDPSNLQHKVVSLKGNGEVFDVLIERVENVLVTSGGATTFSPNVFQLYINRKYQGDISVGQEVDYNDGTFSFVGKVQVCATNIKILKGGKGFKIGEIYNINTDTGFGVVVKVERVGANGTITQAKLISSGVGYAATFTTSILSKKNQGLGLPTAFSSSFDGTNYSVGLTDTTDPLVDYGGFYSYDYTTALDYWPTDYTSVLVRSFFDVGQTIEVDPDLPASIQVTAGPLIKYPGYFASNAGFLSDALYLQDSKYYQTFAYVVKLNQSLDSYGGVLKSLLHPAGTALFGEYVLSDEIAFTIATE